TVHIEVTVIEDHGLRASRNSDTFYNRPIQIGDGHKGVRVGVIALFIIITPVRNKNFVTSYGDISGNLQLFHAGNLPKSGFIYRYYLRSSHITVYNVCVVSKNPHLFNIRGEYHAIYRLIEVVGHLSSLRIIVADFPISTEEIPFIDDQHPLIIGDNKGRRDIISATG